MKRKIGLVVFDLDGTLTPVDSLWSYLHDALGTWDRGRGFAQKYLQGEFSYREWAEADAGLWAGLPMAEFTKVLAGIPYRKGAREVFSELKGRQVKTAILSAGLSILADKAAQELGADLALSNELELNNGSLTGRITVRVAVDGKGKLVEAIAKRFNVPLRETALVGDRANDLINPQCLKIAFNPKDHVAREQAHFVIDSDDLSKILQYIP